jgi:hypothetical protein
VRLNRLISIVLGLGLLAAAQTARAAPLTHDARVAADDGKGEPEIAVDQRNPRYLVDAHMSGIAVSTDGGIHWHESSASGRGDPVVVGDRRGDFFATGLGSNGYQFQLSRDDGRTWTTVGGPLHNPLPVGPSVQDMSFDPSGGPVYMGPSVIGCDRPLSGVDLNTGTLFASCADHGDEAGGESGNAWPAYFATCRINVFADEGQPNCGRRYVSVSHDRGRTWTAWQPEDSADYPAGYTGAFGGIPVGAHGVLATAYIAGAAPGSDCTQCAVFETSVDGGTTWLRHLVPGATPQVKTATGGDLGATFSSDNQTVWFEPYVAADPSRAGHYAIMVLDATRTQLLVYETNSSGATWTGPQVLTRGPSHRVDKPAMAFGPTGALGVMWKSVYASDLSFDVWAAVSPNEGVPFGHPVRLSSRRSDEETCGLGGSEGQAYACDELSWMVMDARHLDATWGANIGGENPWFGRYDFAADPQFRG